MRPTGAWGREVWESSGPRTWAAGSGFSEGSGHSLVSDKESTGGDHKLGPQKQVVVGSLTHGSAGSLHMKFRGWACDHLNSCKQVKGESKILSESPVS